MSIPLPDTIQTADDISRIKLPGSKWTVSVNGNVIVTKWMPSYESPREIVLNWDFDRRILMLGNHQPADETDIIEAMAQVGQPDPKLKAGRKIADRVNDLAGVNIRDITAAQSKLLLACILWNFKALNNDGTIKHPRLWVKNREP